MSDARTTFESLTENTTIDFLFVQKNYWDLLVFTLKKENKHKENNMCL